MFAVMLGYDLNAHTFPWTLGRRRISAWWRGSMFVCSGERQDEIGTEGRGEKGDLGKPRWYQGYRTFGRASLCPDKEIP